MTRLVRDTRGLMSVEYLALTAIGLMALGAIGALGASAAGIGPRGDDVVVAGSTRPMHAAAASAGGGAHALTGAEGDEPGPGTAPPRHVTETPTAAAVGTILHGFDRASGGDDHITREDLVNLAAGGGSTPEERAAARYLLEHGEILAGIDVAARRGDVDGRISRDDLRAAMREDWTDARATADRLVRAAEERDDCGWLSMCRLERIGGGIADFGTGVVRGVWGSISGTAQVAWGALQFGGRLVTGDREAWDSVGRVAHAVVTDPVGSGQAVLRFGGAIVDHYVGLVASCTTRFEAGACGEAVGEIGLDVAIGALTGGTALAASRGARAGALVARHADDVALVVRHADDVALVARHADDAALALRTGRTVANQADDVIEMVPRVMDDGRVVYVAKGSVPEQLALPAPAQQLALPAPRRPAALLETADVMRARRVAERITFEPPPPYSYRRPVPAGLVDSWSARIARSPHADDLLARGVEIRIDRYGNEVSQFVDGIYSSTGRPIWYLNPEHSQWIGWGDEAFTQWKVDRWVDEIASGKQIVQNGRFDTGIGAYQRWLAAQALARQTDEIVATAAEGLRFIPRPQPGTFLDVGHRLRYVERGTVHTSSHLRNQVSSRIGVVVDAENAVRGTSLLDNTSDIVVVQKSVQGNRSWYAWVDDNRTLHIEEAAPGHTMPAGAREMPDFLESPESVRALLEATTPAAP